MPRLRRSRTTRPGLSRRRSGTGFRYLDTTGSTLASEEDRDRIDALAIPPAWTQVWISPDPLGHIQAIGTDAAGRRQYLYHPVWRDKRDRTKFDRALDLAATLTAARAQVTRDLRDTEPSKSRALAAAFRILDTASPRIGGEHYLEANGSHGLSTLQCRHVETHGDSVSLSFVGKGGLDWASDFEDHDLAAVLRSLKRRGSAARLLAYKSEGSWHPLAAHEINDYVRERTRGEFTAKDFRTLRGTIIAAQSLAASGPSRARRDRQAAISRAMVEASDALGNTPTIARKSYVDPRVVDRYRRGRVIEVGRGSAPERALRELLGVG
ncbi:DNA topoisomerase IB [soil metagenome]